jgi:GNAT superfamily N-acetyltransferase
MSNSVVLEELGPSDLGPGFLDGYQRQQEVERSFRGPHGDKELVETRFVDDWNQEDRKRIALALEEAAETGGWVVRASLPDLRLAGFAALSPERLGPDGEYLELLLLHVDARMRGNGIGTELFSACADVARQRGARRLYISSQSSEQTVEFYRSVGCNDASWLSSPHVADEPEDYQLEYALYPR